MSHPRTPPLLTKGNKTKLIAPTLLNSQAKGCGYFHHWKPFFVPEASFRPFSPFTTFCSPPEASSRLLGTGAKSDSTHRRLFGGSESEKLRLCHYFPWKHSKLLGDLWGRSLSGMGSLRVGSAKGSLLSQVKFTSESCKNTGVPSIPGRAELLNVAVFS